MNWAWGLDVPEEFGGANLPLISLAAAEEDSPRLRPLHHPPDSPNLHMMLSVASPVQRESTLSPTRLVTRGPGDQRARRRNTRPG